MGLHESRRDRQSDGPDAPEVVAVGIRVVADLVEQLVPIRRTGNQPSSTTGRPACPGDQTSRLRGLTSRQSRLAYASLRAGSSPACVCHKRLITTIDSAHDVRCLRGPRAGVPRQIEMSSSYSGESRLKRTSGALRRGTEDAKLLVYRWRITAQTRTIAGG
jgi:hypothetical protein